MPGARLSEVDGTFTVTQSWLRDFLDCPERARRQLLDPRPSTTDATTRGNAMHVYMEKRLRGWSRDDSMNAAMEYLEYTVEQDPDFTFVQVKTMDTLRKHVETCIATMERHVMRQLAPGGQVEAKVQSFLFQHRGYQVYLEGTPDYIDPHMRVWDWKSSGRFYNSWEAQNWMIQPTAYTLLASEALLRTVRDFTYAVVLVPSGDLQIVDVERTRADWEWLHRIIEGALEMVLHMPKTISWPVRHESFLCSPKWCPYFDTCRGAVLSSAPWQDQETADTHDTEEIR